MDITDARVETPPAEDKQNSQSSDGGACAEDKQGGPSCGGAVDVAPPAPAKKKREKKVIMETPSESSIDPLFFAKLSATSKRIQQEARRHRFSSLPII